MNIQRILVFGWVVVSVISVGARPVDVIVASGGKARMPVVVAPGADADVSRAAMELTNMLQRITGAAFEMVAGDGTKGLAVGTPDDFPLLGLEAELEATTPTLRERCLIRSHDAGIYLIGASPAAAAHAVWGWMEHLGYRQYFPTPTWEIVPTVPELKTCLDVLETPAFFARSFGYDHGYWGYNKSPHERWMRRNRVASGFKMSSGHAYQAIVAANKDVFAAHPEYLGLVDGKRSSSKLCIANPDLRRLVVEHAERYFKRHPEAQCISMEPSDGGGWCECKACAALGSISDRAAILANEVARAHPQRCVGMLAYNYHAVPPSIPVAPNVMVRVTTHQARGGMTLEQRLAGWNEQGAVTGVSDALCTFVWDNLYPGRQKGSDLVALCRDYARYHTLGVRLVGGWTSDAWGTVGLGNYLLARIGWNIDNAASLDGIFDEFLTHAFASGREPMETFFRAVYRVTPEAPRPMVSEDFVGRMYRLLDEGLAAADGNPAVRKRIQDLVLYIRYVELFFAYENAVGETRQQAFEKLLRFVYRIRETEMIHSKPLWSYQPHRDKTVQLPEDIHWGTPPAKDPWKEDRPYSEAETLAVLKQGIAENKPLNFVTRTFSHDLVPVIDVLEIPASTPGNSGVQNGQARQRIYTWVQQPGPIVLEVTGGLIAHYRNRGPVRIGLHSPAAPSDDALYRVDHDENTPPDGKPHEVVLQTPHVGLHWIEVLSGGDRAVVRFRNADTPRTFECRSYHPGTPWTMYFYVPPDTKLVGGYAADNRGAILDGDGTRRFDFGTMSRPGHFRVPVPEGQGGRFWKFSACRGQRLLMTVPPYLAEAPELLLLPREVVESSPSANVSRIRSFQDRRFSSNAGTSTGMRSPPSATRPRPYRLASR